MVFVLSLFVPHLSFFWYLGKVVFRDCGSFLGIFPIIFVLFFVTIVAKEERIHFQQENYKQCSKMVA